VILEKTAQEACIELFGCPLLPLDVYFDEDTKDAFVSFKKGSDTPILEKLKSAGTDHAATLTLIGYKGGDPKEQINQDRSFVMDPFLIRVGSSDDDSFTTTGKLLGVFDGHAARGELVSDFVLNELPRLLHSKLSAAGVDLQTEEHVQQALVETFVELDTLVPADPSGGCTCSVILQLGNKVYVANAGDSVSFVAVTTESSSSEPTTDIIYQSREDKPHLPEERNRIEEMGGEVYVPENPGGTSRAIYVDPITGGRTGLAMSRSIGDWDVGKLGVIPNPIVDIVDLSNYSFMGEERFSLFAVSATDGLMDYIEAPIIAQHVATHLFHDDTTTDNPAMDDNDANRKHVLIACEELVLEAAGRWQKAKGGRYRDDIAIAVTKLTLPPSSSTSVKEEL
jgi:serine/threonine protein phosphatase PrpC